MYVNRNVKSPVYILDSDTSTGYTTSVYYVFMSINYVVIVLFVGVKKLFLRSARA